MSLWFLSAVLLWARYNVILLGKVLYCKVQCYIARYNVILHCVCYIGVDSCVYIKLFSSFLLLLILLIAINEQFCFSYYCVTLWYCRRNNYLILHSIVWGLFINSLELYTSCSNSCSFKAWDQTCVHSSIITEINDQITLNDLISLMNYLHS